MSEMLCANAETSFWEFVPKHTQNNRSYAQTEMLISIIKGRNIHTCSNYNVDIVHRAQDNSWTADNFHSIFCMSDRFSEIYSDMWSYLSWNSQFFLHNVRTPQHYILVQQKLVAFTNSVLYQCWSTSSIENFRCEQQCKCPSGIKQLSQ